jgi:hypothetical protein
MIIANPVINDGVIQFENSTMLLKKGRITAG